MTIEVKECRTCGTEKPVAEFAKKQGKPGAHCLACKRDKETEYRNRPAVLKRRKDKNNEYVSRWRDRHPDKQRGTARRYLLMSKFGLTVEEYDQMLEDQGGVCKVCGKPESAIGNGGAVKNLAVDHDHKTGVNRGLLCQRCNMAIGLLSDSPEHLECALDYLRAAVALQA